MQNSFEVSSEFVAEIRGNALKVEVDKLPAISRNAIWEYGLQRILNDAAGKAGPKPGSEAWAKANPGKAATEAEVKAWAEATLATADAKLQALYNGDLRQPKGEGVARDPVRTEMVAIVREALRSAGKLPRDPKEQAEVIRATIAKNEEKLRAKAEAAVALRAANAEEFDLG